MDRDRPAEHRERSPALTGVREVGILGGTFNPPHLGHLAIARHAREELGLGWVLVVPARIPPHKPAAEDPGPEHRLRMCRLCVEGVDGLSVCELEIERRGPSYSVDTLRAIHSRHPDAQVTFIVGADTASTLPAWREPARLLELADLAVAARTGSDREEVLETLTALLAGGRPDASGDGRARIRFLDMPTIEVSSSIVRERAARGDAIDDLVGGAVASYIHEHRLYASRAPVPS